MSLIQKEKAYGDYIMLFTILSLLVLLFGYAVVTRLGAHEDHLGRGYLYYLLHGDDGNYTGENNTNSSGHSITGVSSYLAYTVVCGDGIVDPTSEECDDGNTDPNDGCNDCHLPK